MSCVETPAAQLVREARRSRDTITVLFTDVPHTLDALRLAATLGNGLAARIRILVPVVVPWPLTLAEAPISHAHLMRRLTTIAEGAAIPTHIVVVNCRDRERAIEGSLDPNSIVSIGWQRRWLFDATGRLVERLRGEGTSCPRRLELRKD
jgi:hypothetical protein